MTSLRHVRTAAARMGGVTEVRAAADRHFVVDGVEFAAVVSGERLQVHVAPGELAQRVSEVPGSSEVALPDGGRLLEVALADVNGMVANALLGAAWSHCSGAETSSEPTTAADLPAVGRPATRALLGAGVTHLEQLHGWRRDDVLALHGVGPRAVAVLEAALAERGLGWAQPDGTQQTP